MRAGKELFPIGMKKNNFVKSDNIELGFLQVITKKSMNAQKF